MDNVRNKEGEVKEKIEERKRLIVEVKVEELSKCK